MNWRNSLLRSWYPMFMMLIQKMSLPIVSQAKALVLETLARKRFNYMYTTCHHVRDGQIYHSFCRKTIAPISKVEKKIPSKIHGICSCFKKGASLSLEKHSFFCSFSWLATYGDLKFIWTLQLFFTVDTSPFWRRISIFERMFNL